MQPVEKIIRKHLAKELVKSVTITPETNLDDEKILRVDVVYDEDIGAVSADDIIEITAEIWRLLAKIDRAFPVTNFISSRDWKVEHAA